MNISILVSYLHAFIPPRCRKPQNETLHESVDMSVEEVATEMAPVAIIQKTYNDKTISYLWYKERLWIKAGRNINRDDGDVEAEWLKKNARYFFRVDRVFGSVEAARETLEKISAKFILVDNVLYNESVEPVYHSMAFGMGHNHGSTALMDDCAGCVLDRGNFESFFSLLEKDEAIAYTAEVARKRQDTNSLPIVPHSEYTVLIPEAIRFSGKAVKEKVIDDCVMELRGQIAQLEGRVSELLAKKNTL